MPQRPDDICPLSVELDLGAMHPHAPGIFLASVYRCSSPDQAQSLLSGQQSGYVYQRDGHPNADMIAGKCQALHQADWTLMTGSGMGAMALAALTYVVPGDHVVISDQLYGRSQQLLSGELTRMGVETSVVDTNQTDTLPGVVNQRTRLLVVETISNPMLRVADIPRLSQIAHDAGALLLVDNTFASPYVCQPLECGADLVVESLSKMMNGHSDVMLGMLGGRDVEVERARDVLSVWGLASSPFDCWLALRGLATLHLRMERACSTAAHVAVALSQADGVAAVHYPGLNGHPDRELADAQFNSAYGSMVTFSIAGGRPAAAQFMRSAGAVQFCPSLGEVSTTISHPASTSHRGLTADERSALGIEEGTLRLSVGTESQEYVLQAMQQGLLAASPRA